MNKPQNNQKQGKPDQQVRNNDNNTNTEIDSKDELVSPQMSEGDAGGRGNSPASNRSGTSNSQYGTNSSRTRGVDAPKTVKGSTDEESDTQGEKSVGGDRDTLSVGRRK